jgi:hypothetical protein
MARTFEPVVFLRIIDSTGKMSAFLAIAEVLILRRSRHREKLAANLFA